MEPTAEIDTSRILEKGPEYLRKQMELEGEAKGGLSAVERLAASKPKYVKTKPVISSKQIPLITFSSPSGSSNGSSNRSSRRSTDNKEGKGTVQPHTDEKGERSPPDGARVVRRSSSKRQRPDSLLMYRQKCELVKPSTNERVKASFVRKALLNSLKDKATTHEAIFKTGGAEETEPGAMKTMTSNARAQQTRISVDVRKPRANNVLEIEGTSRKCVARSHSDISSRYSKNFSEFEMFFKYCGLDGDVIESLGKENFSARSDDLSFKIRSVSVSTSDDGFTRESGDSDGLLEEELRENIRLGTSVIERNARIIKWLYSCKNAQESGKALRDLD